MPQRSRRFSDEVLADCERGEESTPGTYKKVLLRELPEDLRQILEKHECIKALRDAELERQSAQPGTAQLSTR